MALSFHDLRPAFPGQPQPEGPRTEQACGAAVDRWLVQQATPGKIVAPSATALPSRPVGDLARYTADSLRGVWTALARGHGLGRPLAVAALRRNPALTDRRRAEMEAGALRGLAAGEPWAARWLVLGAADDGGWRRRDTAGVVEVLASGGAAGAHADALALAEHVWLATHPGLGAPDLRARLQRWSGDHPGRSRPSTRVDRAGDAAPMDWVAGAYVRHPAADTALWMQVARWGPERTRTFLAAHDPARADPGVADLLERHTRSPQRVLAHLRHGLETWCWVAATGTDDQLYALAAHPDMPPEVVAAVLDVRQRHGLGLDPVAGALLLSSPHREVRSRVLQLLGRPSDPEAARAGAVVGRGPGR